MTTIIITRIFGGLGNQLFCYAAARRLALANNAELVIDDVSGFVYDTVYKRRYQLTHFSIPCRTATAGERLEPFYRIRRYIKRTYNLRRPFEERSYIQQEGIELDPRLLQIKLRGTLYLEGYWQSENYFKDVEQTIRSDLRIKPPTDAANTAIVARICDSLAVAVHVRFFDESETCLYNVPRDYYARAVAWMETRLQSPHYFVFSDRPAAARAYIPLPDQRITCVSHNHGDENAFADLWLMTQCSHFIIANSTFSWWGAWLGGTKGKIVTTPKIFQDKIEKTNWGFHGLIPAHWIEL
ncbi:MAG: alpha-1,2-fucosyltransferase [Syntrophus sp. (in: bacteria)]